MLKTKRLYARKKKKKKKDKLKKNNMHIHIKEEEKKELWSNCVRITRCMKFPLPTDKIGKRSTQRTYYYLLLFFSFLEGNCTVLFRG